VVRSLRSHLGGNEALAVTLMPPLVRLLGEDASASAPPDVTADLAAPERRRHRIDHTIVQAISGFVAADLDLVIVLDDLQWADPPTLRLLGLLLSEPMLGPMLLIGAFRSEEVHADHPLALARQQWKADRADIAEVDVGPLDSDAVAQMIALAVGLEVTDTTSLADAVVARTGGEALFTRIYLAELAQRGLITFDAARGHWHWDLRRIAQQTLAESAPALVRDRVIRSGRAVRDLLVVIAHLDSALPLTVLADLVDAPVAWTRQLAETAEADGLLHLDRDDRFRFVHDRVRQVMLDDLDEPERQRLHLRLGRRLRDRLHGQPAGEEDVDLFSVVAQLNRARHLITDPGERAQLLELDRMAAQRAHGRAAYAAALALHRIALELLPDADAGEGPDRGDLRSLRRELLVLAAQNALLAGEPDLIEPLCEQALTLTTDPVERSRAHLVLFHHWWQRQQPREMLAELRRTLADFGEPLPDPTGVHHVLAEAITTTRALRGVGPEDVRHLPACHDQVSDAIVRASLAAANAGYVHDPLTMVLLGLRNTRRMLRHGISPASAYAVCTYGFVLTALLGRVTTGHAWSRAAVVMGEDPRSSARGATVFMHNAFVAHWARPMAETLAPLRESHQAGVEEGDVGYPVAGLFFHDLHALLLGQPLDGLAATLGDHAEVMRGLHQWSNLQRLSVVQQAVAELRSGSHERLLDGVAFSSSDWLGEHRKATDLTLWIHSLRGFLALRHGQMADAREAAAAGHGLGRLAPGQAVIALQTFNEAVVWADAARSASGRRRAVLIGRATTALLRLRRWRHVAWDNQAHRVALVEAEIAAATGRATAAMAAYERATALAARNGWLADLGLACDRAAGFHQREGSVDLAAHYVRLGLAAHRSWRADGVVAAFLSRWEGLVPSAESEAADRTNDRALAEVGRTLGAELTAEDLMGRMLQLLVEQSGATSGYLVLPDSGQLRVEAAAHVDGRSVQVTPGPGRDMTDHEGLSAPIVRYVARTRQMIEINDVRRDRRQRLDPGLHATGVRAVLCLPLTTPGGLAGVVHLANDLTAGAFDADRIEVLRLLSVQAAIAIDNARLATGTQRLTRDLAEMREAANRLADQALTDSLTGLPNRYWLDARLDEALRLAGTDGLGVSLLYCDLDGFKAVNDALGHQAGDDLLVDMTRRLTAAVRPGDKVTRVGGDEFVVLLQSDSPGDGVREVADRIIAGCGQHIAVDGVSLHLGVSVGAATAVPDVDTAETLMARADAAMYRAKAGGKGGVVIAATERPPAEEI
ncbi:MAG TPA: diguanylate cyclase, partial [Euzebya sp.]|nr:diguanylate cyclase [Euzebya sp.]